MKNCKKKIPNPASANPEFRGVTPEDIGLLLMKPKNSAARKEWKKKCEERGLVVR